MDKRIGNIFIFLLISCLFGSMHAAITLRITDTQGHELEQVGAGQPFTVEVMIKDADSATLTSVKGDPQIVFLPMRGQEQSSINGKQTAKYTYTARIDEQGQYNLGPATLVQAGRTVNSNVITITVGAIQKTTGKQKETEGVLIDLAIQKKHLFVGESTPIILTFYYGDGITLKNIIPPTYDGFTWQGDVNTYVQGQETIKGSVYNYIRWEWRITPTKSGQLTIPAYGAEYEKISSLTNRFGLEMFFGGRLSELQRTYSNALSLHVDSLPAYNGAVTAIGNFKNVTATMQPSTAQEGEALVLAIEFEGDADLDAIKTPELQNMPEALKYYDSKNLIIPAKDTYHFPQKRFEYIVQGLRAGTWEIPSQAYVIFDTKRKQYTTFKTKPLTVTITSNTQLQKTPNATQESVAPELKSNNAADTLCAINEIGPWYTTHQRFIPFWLFVLLSILPCIGIALCLAWPAIRKRVMVHEPALRAKKAFTHARNALNEAKKQNDAAQLYHIMVQLIADRCRIDSKEVTHDFIEEKLQKAGLSSIDRTKWHDFFAQITESAYSKTASNAPNLFAQAAGWIDRLEAIL